MPFGRRGGLGTKGLSEIGQFSSNKTRFTYEIAVSGQRESNPHGQLGRLELYH